MKLYYLIQKCFAHLFGFKYSYLSQIIFKQIYLTPRLDSNRYTQNNSNNLHTVLLFQVFLTNTHFAQSAGAVEYTDCTSAEG